MPITKNRLGAALALSVSVTSGAALADESEVLNIYNWSDYIAPEAIEAFSEKTGIEVSSNPGIYPSEEVKAKLFTQNAHTPKFDRILNRSWSNTKTGR